MTAPDYKIPEVHRPTVSHYVPLSNAVNISRNTTITLWFSELMDEPSVEEHFQVYPRSDLDSIQTIASAYDDPNQLYAGRLSLGIFNSSDNTSSWYWRTSKTLRKTVKKFAVARTNSEIVYAATEDGVYKSDNTGNTWIPVNTGLTDLSINSVGVDPTDADIVYATTGTAGVFKSEDGGNSWFAKNNGVSTSRPLHDITINPSNSDVLFIATDGNFILRSVDGAESWVRLRRGLGSRDYYTVAVHPLDSNLVFAGSADEGVFRSTDNGENWIDISTNLSNLVINTMALDPSDTNTVYVGTEGGIFKTNNAGVSDVIWNTIGPDWESINIKSILVHPLDNMLLFTCIPDDGIHKSTDGGITWIKSSNLANDNILESGVFVFEIWQDSTTIITPIDSVTNDTSVIFPYILDRALEGWDETGDPPVETDPLATKMIFIPDSTLIVNCEYRARVKGKFQSDDETLQTDPSAAMDLNGNSLESDASFLFTTGD